MLILKEELSSNSSEKFREEFFKLTGLTTREFKNVAVFTTAREGLQFIYQKDNFELIFNIDTCLWELYNTEKYK